MDPQKVLESLAREKGVPLTSLGEVSSCFSQSGKVACCGGLMIRLVTESAADSTVLLRDGRGSCYCALHGDITNRYPDVLTTGALLLFTDITVLVLSSKVPPLLVACLQNLSGLLLPDEASTAAAAVGTVEPMVESVTAGNLDSVTSDTHFCDSVDTGEIVLPSSKPLIATSTRPSEQRNTSRQCALLGERTGDQHFVVAAPGNMFAEQPNCSAPAIVAGSEANGPPEPKRARMDEAADVPVVVCCDSEDDDDAECLELVDDL